MRYNKKGFTLIELIVIMSIIGILVLLAIPKFIGYTENARFTKIISNTKELENASERYYIDHQDWPRLSDKPYTAEAINEITNKIYDETGRLVTLDVDGKYYDIDYTKLQKYVQKPKDEFNYIIQNPVGDVFYLNNPINNSSNGEFDTVPTPKPEPITTFVKSYGGTKDDYFNSIEQTNDNGYVVAGYSYSNNGDLSNNKGFYDFMIAKLDSKGNKTWFKSYGGGQRDSFEAVKQVGDGGYVAVGYSESMDGDLTNNKGQNDAIIAKFDKDGNKEWIKAYGGSGSDCFISFLQTSDGGYIAVGNSNSTDGDLSGLSKGSYDGIIVKLDRNGNKEWIRTYGGSGFEAFKSIQSTSDGNYVVVGLSDSNNGDLSSNKGYYDFVIAKFDNNGNKIWFKSYGGSKHDYLISVHQTSSGEFITVGYSFSNNGDLFGLNKGDQDAIIAKFSNNGDKIWIKNYGGTATDYFNSVQETNDSGYIISGYSGSDDGDLSGINKGTYDAIITKVDSNGNKIWFKSYGGNNYDYLCKIKQINNGSYVAVGSSSSTSNDLSGLNKGGYDAVIFSIDTDGNIAE